MTPLPVRPFVSLPAILFYSTLAFIIALILTPIFVRMLHRYKLGKQLRVQAVDGGSASVFLSYHQKKAGTPTMGGVLIWVSIVLTVFLSRIFSYQGVVDHSLLQRGQVYIPLGVLLGFGIIGAIDDYFNICGLGKNRGINALPKMFLFLLVSIIPAYWFFSVLGYDTINIPFGIQLLGRDSLHLGWMYIPFFLFVVIGTTNAVNVTDGLDGLAGGLLIIDFSAFGVIAYVTELYVLAAFCGVTAGALAAFLWFNVPPALFYMGDTGALALGGTLAVIAFMINQVLVLPLIGFIFVIEMLSVIIQLTSKKLRGGKKVFRSAPIHHHFEALEWGESKVTMRFWIVGAFMAFLGVLVGIYG
jgi:phospho-N-acetylmuramoyl-pentapeptide-transferase